MQSEIIGKKRLHLIDENEDEEFSVEGSKRSKNVMCDTSTKNATTLEAAGMQPRQAQ